MKQHRVLLVCGIFLALSCGFPLANRLAQTQQRGQTVRPSMSQLPGADKRWAIVIGVDEYDDTAISRLSGAVNDAKALAEALKTHGGFREERVTLLASDQPRERRPTRGTILRRLTNLKGALPPDGLLLFAFAGHGIERNGQSFLLPSDAQDSRNLSLLEETSLNVERLKLLIRETGVKQVFVILDACRNDPSAGRANADNLMTSNFSRSFDFDTRNREVEAFVTLYATSVGARSYEYSEKRQGYFTWSLIEGLKGRAANERGEITLGNLVSYLERIVPDLVTRDLGARQRPFAQVEGYRANDLVLAVNAAPVATVTSPPPRPIANNPAPAARMSVTGVPLRSFDFQTLTVDANGRLSPKRTAQAWGFTDNTNGVPLEMVEIEGGAFTMGSPDSEQNRSSDEGPQRRVTVSGFAMGKFEVTQAQWQAVARLPKVKIDLSADPANFTSANLPVVRVSWDQAVEFCARLSRLTGRNYRLPTEAEWEYAARAGKTTPFAFGATVTPDIVNYNGNYPYGNAGKGQDQQKTVPVGSLGAANPWGLFDVHGNVWEWCEDLWHENYNGAPSDGSAWLSGGDSSRRVLRGGSWRYYGFNARSASRLRFSPGYIFNDLGFRVVCARTP